MLVLGLRSWYSYSGGFLSPDDAVAAAKDAGATSVAFADLYEMAGYGEFMDACEKHELKAIAGIELNILYKGEVRPVLIFADSPDNVPLLFSTVQSATSDDRGLTIDLESSHLKDLLLCT